MVRWDPPTPAEGELSVPAVAAAAGVALALLLAPLTLPGQTVADQEPPPDGAVAGVAEQYLEAWQAGDHSAMRRLVLAAPEDLDAVHQAVVEELGVVSSHFRRGDPDVRGTAATVPFVASLELAGLGNWSYAGRLDLVLAEPEEPPLETAPVGQAAAGGEATVDRELTSGRALPATVTAGRPRWVVAWSPATVHPALGPGLALARSRTVPPRAPLLGTDGALLTGEAAPDLPALSAQLLGGLVTLDEAGAAALGFPYLPGDVAGASGLQAAFEAQLSGTPGGTVTVVDGAGAVVEVLHEFPDEEPRAVRTTIDPELQAAAESALGRSSRPGALVAVDAPSGEVRAVASRPTIGFNRALAGSYPPGSTFKIVTSAALLGSGVGPDTPTSCPPSAAVGGFGFSNAGGESLGDIPFATAFSRSCNTAFVQLAEALEPGLLAAAAETFGFNGDFDLPVPAPAGSFPRPTGLVDKAAAAIGQGRVTASPLQMATVAAAVASGTWQPPRLVETEAARPGRELAPGVAETLRELMYLVVEEGTGTAARLPGEPVAGKTGTAEYGTARPPRSHAWFVGFRGDLAFAVLVEDGGSGGSVAAPIARSFLADL